MISPLPLNGNGRTDGRMDGSGRVNGNWTGKGVSPYIYPPFRKVTSRHCSGSEWDGGEFRSPYVSCRPGVFSIELHNQLRCMYIVPRLPGVVLHSEVFPFDKVAEFSVHHLAIQDLFHYPFVRTSSDTWSPTVTSSSSDEPRRMQVRDLGKIVTIPPPTVQGSQTWRRHTRLIVRFWW
jgi:hypothetical protein